MLSFDLQRTQDNSPQRPRIARQVIKATRDECPMCRQKLSPAILRFLETRDPHWTAPQGHLKNVFRHQTQVVQAPGLPVW